MKRSNRCCEAYVSVRGGSGAGRTHPRTCDCRLQRENVFKRKSAVKKSPTNLTVEAVLQLESPSVVFGVRGERDFDLLSDGVELVLGRHVATAARHSRREVLLKSSQGWRQRRRGIYSHLSTYMPPTITPRGIGRAHHQRRVVPLTIHCLKEMEYF